MTLHEYIRANRARRFRYGRHDCALFAAGWVIASGGPDLTLGITYASLTDGLAQLRARGFSDHVAVAAAHLPAVPVLRARAGDLAEIDGALGIVTGETVAVLARNGVGVRPLTDARRAFRVGG